MEDELQWTPDQIMDKKHMATLEEKEERINAYNKNVPPYTKNQPDTLRQLVKKDNEILH